MATGDKIARVARKMKNKVGGMIRGLASGLPDDLPGDSPQSREEVANYVVAMWEEAKDWRARAYMDSKDDRFGFGDPMQFWRDCSKLEAGNHYDVYGKRTDDSAESKWKAEFVD